MKRREFITLLGGAAARVAARGAGAAAGDAGGRVPPAHRSVDVADLRRFHQGLKEGGFVDGQNVVDRISLGGWINLIDCRRWQLIWLAAAWP